MSEATRGCPAEIACDESGAEGKNLDGGRTDVIAHASVWLPADAAAETVQWIRARIHSPVAEFKASHLLRANHRAVLPWLLAPGGPIHGRAHVHLIEKQLFNLHRITEFLLTDGFDTPLGISQDERAAGVAAVLYRDGPQAVAEADWREFLALANDLVRIRWRPSRAARAPVDGFFACVTRLARATAGTRLGDALDLLGRARPAPGSVREQLFDNPNLVPALDPVIPAVVATITHWRKRVGSVLLIHDELSALTPGRVDALRDLFAVPDARGGLVGVRRADSRLDARVQIADFLAGIARTIASAVLNERADQQLTELLRPYVGVASHWGDQRSWSALAPGMQASGATTAG